MKTADTAGQSPKKAPPGGKTAQPRPVDIDGNNLLLKVIFSKTFFTFTCLWIALITNDLEKRIVEAFEVFDHAGNKTVDIREVGTIIRSLGNLTMNCTTISIKLVIIITLIIVLCLC